MSITKPSTSNAQDATVTSWIKCKGEKCHKKFATIAAILHHLAAKPSCKKEYNESELDELKERRDLHKKFQVTSAQNKSIKPDETPSPNNSNVGENSLIQCKGCPQSFPFNSIKIHLAKRPSCKKEYTEEDELELEKKLDAQKKTFQHENRDKFELKCKNPYCKSKKSRKKFNARSLIEHLRLHEICEGYFTQSEIEDLNEAIDKKTNSFPSGENIVKLEIYSDGYEMINNCTLDAKMEFNKRLRKKEEIWGKLRDSMTNISKYHENEDDWLNNLVDVENGIYDLINHHTYEIAEWRDIWTNEHDVHQFMSKVTKKYQTIVEIWKMKSHLQDYNIETKENLSKKVKTAMSPYTTEDRTEAIALAKKIDKLAVQIEVTKLLNFAIWTLQNVYQYSVQKMISCFENIKHQQLIDDELPFLCILKGLKITVSQDLEDGIDLDHVICKGCPNNPKKFTEKTILKHLKHSANKKCLTIYDNDEIAQMENIRKLHKLITTQNWKKRNQEIYEEKRLLNENISKTISKLNGMLTLKNGFPVKKCLVKIYELLKKKCWNEKENRMTEIQIVCEKLENINLKSSNHVDAENELSQWKIKIEGDILETFQHLEKEIHHKYDYYLNGFLVNPDDMVRKAE